jgi:spore coat protein CotH
MEFPTGEAPVGRDGAVGGPGGGMQRSNILRDRFLADDSFAVMYEQALVDLRAELYAGGTATAILDEWVAVLTNDAADLVDAATVEREASAIAEYFTAD